MQKFVTVTYNKIAIQGTVQMVADKEAVGLSGVHMYESCADEIIIYSVLKHINTTRMQTQSADNLFHSFTILWENEYFLTSNLLCPFTSARSCPLVVLPVFILKDILGSIFS